MIDMSDLVYVINKNGYIGDSVRGEIEYTNKKGIPIKYFEEYKIITLCGSGKFKEEFKRVFKELTMAGHTVLTPAIFELGDLDVGEDDSIDTIHQRLDLIHQRKIDISDEVLVINVGGYIGKDTNDEILYAITNNKRVKFLESSNIDEDNYYKPSDEVIKWLNNLVSGAAGSGNNRLELECPDIYSPQLLKEINEYGARIVKQYILDREILVDCENKTININEVNIHALSFLPLADNNVELYGTWELYHNNKRFGDIRYMGLPEQTYPDDVCIGVKSIVNIDK